MLQKLYKNKEVISKMIARNKHGQVIYIEYTLDVDKNNQQEVLFNTRAGLKYIAMTLYPRHTLLPQIPDLFIDLDRYRHTIDSDANMMMIQGVVSEHLNAYLYEVNPEIEINYNRLKQQMAMNVTISSDTVLQLNAVEDRSKVQYKINNKKFTE